MLNNYRHLFYYSVSFGGIYSSCNANMTLGGLATYIPPCLPKECQVEHLWPSSDLPGSPIPDHSHWFREGTYDPSCQHLSPGVFYLEFQGLFRSQRGGLVVTRRLLVTCFPITYRKKIQSRTSSKEIQGESWGTEIMILVSKVSRVVQISKIFPSIF